MSERFTLTALDGDTVDFGTSLDQPWLRFKNLSFDEAVDLARHCFRQGFQVIIWQQDGGNEGGVDDCET